MDRTIEITEHARERMRERVGVKEQKMLRLATKAWQSTEPVNANGLTRQYRSDHFWQKAEGNRNAPRIIRTLMGLNYIFIERPGVAVLLTVN